MKKTAPDQYKEQVKSWKEETFFPLTTSISSRLQTIFDKKSESLLEELDESIEKILNVCKLRLEKHPEEHPKIFKEACLFLNQIFKILEVKILYTNHPKFPLSWYKESSLGEQFLNNIVDKKEELLERDEITGGSCHYWSVFFKTFFDRLKEIGVPLSSRIFVFNKTFGHSWVIIEYQGKNYLADISWYNKPLHKAITELNSTLHTYKKEVREILFFLIQQNTLGNQISYFQDTSSFSKYLRNKASPSLGISINTKDYYDKNQNVQIKLSFTPKQLVFQKEDDIHYLPYPENFVLDLPTEDKILETMITQLSCEKKLKAELKHYLTQFKGKINLEKLYELLLEGNFW